MPFSVAQLVFQSITDPEFTGMVWLNLIALQSLDPISWPVCSTGLMHEQRLSWTLLMAARCREVCWPKTSDSVEKLV